LILNVFFPSFPCCTQSDHAQEDLAKSGYKTNRKANNLGILSHVGKALNLSAKYGNFKRRKLKIYPNLQKS
jgi:hypothetical protein